MKKRNETKGCGPGKPAALSKWARSAIACEHTPGCLPNHPGGCRERSFLVDEGDARANMRHPLGDAPGNREVHLVHGEGLPIRRDRQHVGGVARAPGTLD